MNALSEDFNRDWLKFKSSPENMIVVRSSGLAKDDVQQFFPMVELEQSDLDYALDSELLHEWHKEDGQIHRVGGPAIIIRDPEDPDKSLFEGWYQNGKLHREDGPAITRRRDAHVEQEWWQDDKLHREDGPAEIWTEENGSERYYRWCLNGIEHREGGPAYMCRDNCTGVEYQEIWIQHGKYHRLDGPAFILRDSVTGQVHEELWCREGEPFRRSGPATIMGMPGSKPYMVSDYFINGVSVDPPRELAEVMAPGGP